jgi:hypothetical protein
MKTPTTLAALTLAAPDDGAELCTDCGKLSHPVTAVAWTHAVLGSDPILCIPCVGRRLGRSAAPWDFKPDAPANAWMQWQGAELNTTT